jgi:hypothetical protein
MREVELFRSERQFRIWEYTVGHETLTLRSLKAAELPTRVDIRFVAVRSINLPTKMNGITVVVETAGGATPHDLARDGIVVGETAGPYPGGRRFTLRGADYEGSVVAAGAGVHEDTGEHSDPAYWDIDPTAR